MLRRGPMTSLKPPSSCPSGEEEQSPLPASLPGNTDSDPPSNSRSTFEPRSHSWGGGGEESSTQQVRPRYTPQPPSTHIYIYIGMALRPGPGESAPPPPLPRHLPDGDARPSPGRADDGRLPGRHHPALEGAGAGAAQPP